jgi:hypothetical protein
MDSSVLEPASSLVTLNLMQSAENLCSQNARTGDKLCQQNTKNGGHSAATDFGASTISGVAEALRCFKAPGVSKAPKLVAAECPPFLVFPQHFNFTVK